MHKVLALAAAIFVLAPGFAGADLAPVNKALAHVYPTPLDTSRPVTSLRKGVSVEILGRETGWVRVRTQDGTVGFMKETSLDFTQVRPGTFGGETPGPGPATGAPTGSASAGSPSDVRASGAPPAGTGFGTGTRITETHASAAGSGFSDEIEREYRKQNPQLEDCYEQVDILVGIQHRRNWGDPEALRGFRREGKLGEFAE